jgi:alanyl-tRNA synthetase
VTERLYYTDSLLTAFDARVVSCAPAGGRFHVALDRTAFYPTSGGQPFDTGRLNAAHVLDVVEDEAHEVVHVVDEPCQPGADVRGEIDWTRRFDHMQQHTGQHILSAAFDRLHGVRTTSFHLGAAVATIDLAREVTVDEIARAEDESNRIVWENRPVRVRFASEGEARAMPLRKEPVRTGPLRLVEVADFDLSACGGTHVPETGRIGIIAVVAAERFKGASRLTFVCGARALHSHRMLRDVVVSASRALSVSAADLPAAIERLQGEAKDAARALKRAQDELTAGRAEKFRRDAETIGPVRGVLTADSAWDATAIKLLAGAIVSERGLVAVLVGGGTPAPVVAARSADVVFDAGAWMKHATAAFGGRGGGRPELAQGGITAAPEDILKLARETLSQTN